jgi:hypothetical protein
MQSKIYLLHSIVSPPSPAPIRHFQGTRCPASFGPVCRSSAARSSVLTGCISYNPSQLVLTDVKNPGSRPRIFSAFKSPGS